MSKKERLLFAATVAVTLVLRALAFFRYRFDSDEQQHLHVVWGWTAGLVQYRDVFDNHAPLFHLLTAPLLALVGERRDVLLWMRLPMLVTFAVVIWGTYVLGRELYDERVGRWAALLLALFPPYFLKSVEFRPDNLWTALWIVALVLLVKGRPMFVVGLVFGAAFATSLKTSLLVVSLAVAIAMVVWFMRALPDRLTPPPPGGVLRFLIGLSIVPAVLAIGLAAAGAWDALVYCNFTFNGAVYVTRRNAWVGRAIFPFAFAAVVIASWRWRRVSNGWRYVLAVMTGVFTVTIAGFWVLISPRDFLALMPIGALFAAAFLVRVRRPVLTFAIILLAFTGALWKYADRFENRTEWHFTMLDQALRLTHPGESLMDVKGETIFRRRPSYHAFENIARAQIARGILRDTVPEDVVAKRTYVAQADGPMWPPRARAFLSANFLNMGRLRAAGQWIGEDGSFTIAIPGEYVIVVDRGEARGSLDGTAYAGARMLPAGKHRFVGEKGAAVLWAPAFRRGHSPFHLRDLKF